VDAEYNVLSKLSSTKWISWPQTFEECAQAKFVTWQENKKTEEEFKMEDVTAKDLEELMAEYVTEYKFKNLSVKQAVVIENTMAKFLVYLDYKRHLKVSPLLGIFKADKENVI